MGYFENEGSMLVKKKFGTAWGKRIKLEDPSQKRHKVRLVLKLVEAIYAVCIDKHRVDRLSQ